MPYKFIFDTSAIDDNSVSEMENAGIIQACDSGQINFYMTPPLLRECFHFVTTGNVPRKTEHLEFLIKIRWAGLFNQLNGKDGILNIELVGLPENGYLLLKNSENTFKPEFRNFLKGQKFSAEFREIIKKENADWKSGKNDQMNGALNKRKIFKRDFKMTKDFPFEQIWEKKGSQIMRHYIKGIGKRINPNISADDLIKLWEKQQGECKYLETFIKLHYFQQWKLITPIAEPRRDRNAADDIEHLMYLLYVDGIVSNEKHGFMNNAKQFFPTKDILSVDEFVKKIEVGKKG
ncbi:MAG: hypothetical protein ABIE75_05465 [Candidatus Omnitrophota bacterium]